VTEIPTREFSAVALSPEVAAAASSRTARQLLDAAVSHAIAALAHDLRNSLGIVSMQVEAVAVRVTSTTPDLEAIRSHANVASEHIERLAEMMNALIAFARGRASSDLAVIVDEAATLVPLRAISVANSSVATVGLDSCLTRAVVLEVLVLALGCPAAPTFAVTADEAGSTLDVSTDRSLRPDEALEWVVQFHALGGQLTSTEDGLRLLFPPIA
jgi:signal transduction histidine kinase